MNTPISDFVHEYNDKAFLRLHMPAHKGRGEAFYGLDITEIDGADSLYAPDGIIAKSEKNASEIFGSLRTVYSTEGSSQAIKAMCLLAMQRAGRDFCIIACRNAHRAFISAAELLGFDIHWIYPKEPSSICECQVTARELEEAFLELEKTGKRAAAVYVTSPDYLGNMLDIAPLAETAHAHGALLLCDNAHGAYLRFIRDENGHSRHPLESGADLVCDSAHKTLPVLTGGAYLHSGVCSGIKEDEMKAAMLRFGSTSPSYLILSSMDEANAFLSEYSGIYADGEERLLKLKNRLQASGIALKGNEPLKLTIQLSGEQTGVDAAKELRRRRIEPEFADKDFLVMMPSPMELDDERIERLYEVIVSFAEAAGEPRMLPQIKKAKQILRPREVLFLKKEELDIDQAYGRIAAETRLSCPPAVLPVIAGELIDENVIEILRYYGQERIGVVRE